jgi:hypothetical protein
MSDGFDAIHETDEAGGVDEGAPAVQPGRRKRQDTRRAIAGGIAGVVMLAGPIVLANAIVGHDSGSDDDVATKKDEPSPSLIAQRAQRGAEQSDSVQFHSLLARGTSTTIPPTTTTTAPPTTTTTAPPPTTDPPTTDPPTTDPPMTTPPTTPQPGSGQLGDPNYDGSWDKLAECESGGNWHINTGNGYFGGLQFSLSTWQGLGGTGLPSDHTREVQIAMGKKLWQTSSWAAWPACTAKFGWR